MSDVYNLVSMGDGGGGICPESGCAGECVDPTDPPDPSCNRCLAQSFGYLNSASYSGWSVVLHDSDYTGPLPSADDVRSISPDAQPGSCDPATRPVINKPFPYQARIGLRSNGAPGTLTIEAQGSGTLGSSVIESATLETSVVTVPAGVRWLKVTATFENPVTFNASSALNLCWEFDYPAP